MTKKKNDDLKDFMNAVFKDVTPETLRKEAERLEKLGFIKQYETPFGTITVFKHPFLNKKNNG